MRSTVSVQSRSHGHEVVSAPGARWSPRRVGWSVGVLVVWLLATVSGSVWFEENDGWLIGWFWLVFVTVIAFAVWAVGVSRGLALETFVVWTVVVVGGSVGIGEALNWMGGVWYALLLPPFGVWLLGFLIIGWLSQIHASERANAAKS